MWTTHAGQETGHAVADVLFGDHNPSGRLTQTWYASDAGLPGILDYDIAKTGMTYQYYQGKPLYPFGYGLSYTSFRYGAVRAVGRHGGEGQRGRDEHRAARARTSCSCTRRIPACSGCAPSSVRLKPHETRTVRLEVKAADLASWDVTRGRSVVAAGVTTSPSAGRPPTYPRPMPVFVPGEGPRRATRAADAGAELRQLPGRTLTDQSKASGTSVAAAAGTGSLSRRRSLRPRAALRVGVHSGVGPHHRPPGLADRAGCWARSRCRARGTVRYTTVTAALAKAAGRHDVYLAFDGPVNLATFSLR